MPELPEVETVRRSLEPLLAGRRIVSVRFLARRVAGGKPDPLASRLKGQIIHSVGRLGKHLLFELDHGLLDIHLRMTGKLVWNGMTGPYTRAVFELDKGLLAFDDVRQFGIFVWRQAQPRLGPDALDLDAVTFSGLLRKRRGAVKPALLDQSLCAGLGNIYVDESLFEAGIHPRARASALSKPRLAKLFASVQRILHAAIAAGGSTISNYADGTGQRGFFQQNHQVYGRQGEPCPVCGAAIRRIVISQRGTHYCPRCQKR